jgi:ribosomal protein S18 acetylase RimI-like enzyme
MSAWPALRTILYDGWVLRFSDGFTRRANSVNPLYLSTLDIEQKIVKCEEIYKSVGQPTVFKITEDVVPADLDDLLNERGYAVNAPTSVQTADLSGIDTSADDDIIVTEQLDEHWLDQFFVKSGLDVRYMVTLRKMLSRIMSKRGLFSIVGSDDIIAFGLAVMDHDHVGLYDILTDRKQRRRGLGARISSGMMRWGKANGATTAYLQVMLNNPPALRLYENLGFKEAYKYWYRLKA